MVFGIQPVGNVGHLTRVVEGLKADELGQQGRKVRDRNFVLRRCCIVVVSLDM